MIIGMIYFILALLSMFFWILEPGVCTSESCSAIPGILGQSWYFWGAFFYIVASILSSWLRKSISVGVYLTTGALFHFLLILYGYHVTGEICSVCWKFATVGFLLTLMYWFMPERKVVSKSYLVLGSIVGLGIMSLSLFMLNPDPVTGSVTNSDLEVVTNIKTTTVNTASTDKGDTDKPIIEHTNNETGKENCQLRVLTLNGETKCLDISAKPALVFASWCPHCDEALQEVAKLSLEERPYLVVTYLHDGDKEKAREKLDNNGLENETYYLAPDPPTGLEAVPSFLHWKDGLEIIVFGKE